MSDPNERQSAPTGAQTSEFKQEADRPLGDATCCAVFIQTEGQSEVGDVGDKDHMDHGGLPKSSDPYDQWGFAFAGHITRLALGYDDIQYGARVTGIPEEKLPAILDLWRQLGGIENPRDALQQLLSGIAQKPLLPFP